MHLLKKKQFSLKFTHIDWFKSRNRQIHKRHCLKIFEYFGITNELGLEYKLVLMNHLKNYTFNWAFNKIVLCPPFLAGHCESMWDGVPWAHYPGLATNRQVLDWIVQRGDAEGEWRGHQRHVWMAHRPLSGLCQEKYKSRSQWHMFKEFLWILIT